jgi:uncharacterized repeat protein (TIGR02543 family)
MKKFLLAICVALFTVNCSPEPEIPVYTLTVTAGDGGTVSQTGGSYDEGTSVSITATPNTGYDFSGWTGSETSNSPTISVVMNSNKSITANFSKKQYAINISGSVTKGSYVSGSELTFFELNNSFNQTGKSFNTNITDDLGNFALNISGLTEEYARVVGNGYYWNEVTNEVTESKLTLLGLCQTSQEINLNAITNIEYERVLQLTKEGKTFTQAKTQALNEILTAFGISGQNIQSSEKLNYTKGDTGSKVLLAITATIMSTRTENEISQLMANIANDIKDNGQIDTETIKENIVNGISKINYDQIVTNIINKYKSAYPSLSAASFSPEIFEQVISTDGPFRSDTDGDGIADDIDQCPNTPLIEEADENGCGPSQKAYGLTIETEGNGRVIEEVINTGRTNTYDYGTRVKLTAEAEAGWAFKEWIGSVQSTENPLEYTVNSASTITAVFVDIDADDDGVMDADDLCPNSTAQMGLVDENGCALAQKDTDEDGVTDDIDKCNDTPAGETVNANGCHDYIYLAENGITIKATEYAFIGDTKVINGKTYKLIDESSLREMVTNNEDISLVVTSRITKLSYLFYTNVSFNQDISSWDVSNVTDLSATFQGAESFNRDLSHWDTSKVRSMFGTFGGVKHNLNIGNWNVESVENMEQIFAGSEITNLDISNWDTRSVRNLRLAFASNTFNSNISNWDTSKVTNMKEAFRDAYEFTGDISKWDTSNATDMSSMFESARKFKGDISNWNVSKVKDMHRMFAGAFLFDGDLSKWDISNVVRTSGMFNSSNFNGDISSWNTSNVYDMSEMFYLTRFNKPINNWDVGKVTNMAGMFDGNNFFNQSLSQWDTKNVVNMQAMFKNTPFNKPIGSWDVSKVNNMKYMFEGSSFNQDISSWCVTKISRIPDGFSSRISQGNMPVWGTCPENNHNSGGSHDSGSGGSTGQSGN